MPPGRRLKREPTDGLITPETSMSNLSNGTSSAFKQESPALAYIPTVEGLSFTSAHGLTIEPDQDEGYATTEPERRRRSVSCKS